MVETFHVRTQRLIRENSHFGKFGIWAPSRRQGKTLFMAAILKAKERGYTCRAEWLAFITAYAKGRCEPPDRLGPVPTDPAYPNASAAGYWEGVGDAAATRS